MKLAIITILLALIGCAQVPEPCDPCHVVESTKPGDVVTLWHVAGPTPDKPMECRGGKILYVPRESECVTCITVYDSSIPGPSNYEKWYYFSRD